MDGIANVARQQQTQQQTQVASAPVQGRTVEQTSKSQTQQQNNSIKEIQQSSINSSKKLNSQKDVQSLVKKLNQAVQPMNTDIKFGVDSQDIFYVSVIDIKTNRMIRRFPAEQAQVFLPKMQEVSGMLFDSKG